MPSETYLLLLTCRQLPALVHLASLLPDTLWIHLHPLASQLVRLTLLEGPSLSPAVQVLLINLMPSLLALVSPTTHQLLTFPVCLLAFHKHLLSTYCLPSPA